MSHESKQIIKALIRGMKHTIKLLEMVLRGEEIR